MRDMDGVQIICSGQTISMISLLKRNLSQAPNNKLRFLGGANPQEEQSRGVSHYCTPLRGLSGLPTKNQETEQSYRELRSIGGFLSPPL
jgi:hypothetical protein